MKMPGPTGECNVVELHGRGVVACIRPWNFSLAIFTGQIEAALVAGNCVIAKPAEQTPLIAALAVQLFYQAGVPQAVVQLLPGTGEGVGAKLMADRRVNTVIFTGSTEVAKLIQLNLAKRPGEIVPLIAETGGQNCMLVDSSALPEQIVDDVINSAFGSVGQRCSALRVLYVQDDIADKVITMLVGAMKKLNVGDPALLATDVGPVIDAEARNNLQQHINRMITSGKLLYQVPANDHIMKGTYITPAAFEIDSIHDLQREIFGPILHVIRFKLADLDKTLDDINSTGYGLTFGIHSRVEERIRYVQKKMRVGNMYVNRNMIGAVVGVQPFGGEGLSGTGPKAGGPHYLPRLCVERTLTINTTATGGNASLLSLSDD
jgi:RHH-type proline utilization regulon transcriptional repressor/proline dehydrogenase/delta 1-pyrroline-5-carboxylate dehydrogenase